MIASVVPAASAAATISQASRGVVASGFSERTCRPLAAAAIARSWWKCCGVQTSTRSMSARASRAAASAWQSAGSRPLATRPSSSRAGVGSAIATSR